MGKRLFVGGIKLARTAGLPFKVPSPLAPNLCPPPPLYREGGEPLYGGSIDVHEKFEEILLRVFQKIYT